MNYLEPFAPVPVQNPCIPSPCGPFSECRAIEDIPSCSCLQNYIGSPPDCRPECSINSDCPSNRVCMREKCRDPCPGSCGVLAQCSVNNHVPICTCSKGYIGDPFTNCILNQITRKIFSFVMIIFIILTITFSFSDYNLEKTDNTTQFFIFNLILHFFYYKWDLKLDTN